MAYYEELLNAVVEIYLYRKGFVHAKTMVIDSRVSIVGTANMDYRSFELNFEVNAVVYDLPFSQQIRKVFFEDLKYAEQIDRNKWIDRPAYKQLLEKIARLVSPLL